MPADLQQQVEAMLLANHNWMLYDYLLLRMTAPYLDSNRLVMCIQKASKQNTQLQNTYIGYYSQVVEQTSLTFVCRGERAQLDQLTQELGLQRADIFQGEDAVTNSFLQIVAGTSPDWEPEVSELLDALNLLGLQNMASYFRNIVAMMKSGGEGVLL
jgi:hypothetical protein